MKNTQPACLISNEFMSLSVEVVRKQECLLAARKKKNSLFLRELIRRYQYFTSIHRAGPSVIKTRHLLTRNSETTEIRLCSYAVGVVL